MTTAKLKMQVHELIDQIKDNQLLEAIHTLLLNRDGSPKLTKKEIDNMLEVSENDIHNNQLTDHAVLKEEILSWKRR